MERSNNAFSMSIWHSGKMRNSEYAGTPSLSEQYYQWLNLWKITPYNHKMKFKVLQLQQFFPKFLKFWSPPHDLALFLIVWILEFLGHALILDNFLKITFRPGFQKLLVFGIVVGHRFIFRVCFC